MTPFTLGIDRANNLIKNELHAQGGGALIASANDMHIIGQLNIFYLYLHRHIQRLSEAGIQLQLDKRDAILNPHTNHPSTMYIA